MAIGWLWLLFNCSDKTTQSNGPQALLIFLTGFDYTTLLIDQYLSSGYFLAIVAAMLVSMVGAIAELQPFA